MAELYLSLSGAPAKHVQLHQPNNGPWMASIELENDALDLPATGPLGIGDAIFRCRVSPEFGGTHALGKHVRVIGGNGSWGKLLPEKDYPNDAGVKPYTVALDLAKATGEVLGTFKPNLQTHGEHFVRRAGPASRALEDATGGAAWHVARDGSTVVGARGTAVAPSAAYEVLAFNPRTRVAEIAFDSLAALDVGSRLESDRLDIPQSIQSYDLLVTPTSSRMFAYCGSSGRSTSQMEALIRSIVGRTEDQRLFGKWRYRVINMAGERVNLQRVKSNLPDPAKLPNAAAVRQWPGLPGVKAQLAEGSIVTVEFLEGDPSMPRVTGYAGEEDSNYRAEVVYIGGSENAQEIACKGDTVKSPLPPGVFTGTVGGAPATGVITFPSMSLNGSIQTGTNRAKAGRG